MKIKNIIDEDSVSCLLHSWNDFLNFESNYRHFDYKNIGYLNYHSAITDSEYRYVQKRGSQYREEIRVNDKGILNHLGKFMNKK
ncbi:hypothetical protein Xvie_02024 [Xenorhabdus vietnamensis]|uniref:Uncharacterized protein n=1 Tax=Xenorhabdus vietnamensis TaxID=351656 RepID=A0A1Y2SCB4_9GAMM|nr:hypothetical protein [Xenorhabdus vietnamensis]OTA16254.1 hypothetical protein Xvie_02024 [Xenorhabdus vietnamensis]